MDELSGISGIGFKSSIHSTEVTILSLKENMVEVDIQLETELQNFYVDLNELRQQLKTQIERWKNDYLVSIGLQPMN